MSDDPQKMKRRSLERIDTNDPQALGIWALALGVSPEQLVAAIRVCGSNIASRVREHLSK